MRNRVAEHVAALPKSGIRKFFDIVAQSKDIVSLGVGEPDFDTPWHISRAAVTCLENGGTHYTSNLGTPELRQAICRYLERRFCAKFDWKCEVLATVGVSEAIDLAIRAICSPGDEVLYHEPCFVSYAPTIRLAHAVPVCVETRVEDEFRLTVDALEKKVTPRTKAVLLNFPCNPTGATLSRGDMAAILAFCEKHDLLLLADEVYSELNYEIEGEENSHAEAQSCGGSENGVVNVLPSFAAFPEYRDRVILLNGFSKSWAMTGYRLGYACGPADVIDAMMKIHQYGIMSAPTLAQAAGVAAMDFGDKDVDRMRREYKKRRDWLVPELNALGLKTLMPKGAFYLFVDVRSTGLSDEEFALKLLKEFGVACVPGSAFGACGAGFVRMSYATSLDKIKLAASRIAKMLKSIS
ncbi:MAG: aminotransferase class I/II-fold pyridoxal phosphate-dependent enzyme [Kiritimatiellae bacterium]|nr:aminotransferase class I/II-fold pyridoxal phosphate-dependent enzyme [Kiritimatiellia bacterium]